MQVVSVQLLQEHEPLTKLLATKVCRVSTQTLDLSPFHLALLQVLQVLQFTGCI